MNFPAGQIALECSVHQYIMKILLGTDHQRDVCSVVQNQMLLKLIGPDDELRQDTQSNMRVLIVVFQHPSQALVSFAREKQLEELQTQLAEQANQQVRSLAV